MSRRPAGSRRYAMTLDVGPSSVRAMLYDLQANQVGGPEVQKALYRALTIDRILDTDYR